MNSTTEEAQQENILSEVIKGLSKPQKSLPSKLFYDERGSRLFDEICKLDEYYPTQTETKIMEDNIEEIASHIGDECVLVELGSGSSVKIRLLIDHLPTLAAYIPVDISSDHLINSTEDLKSDHPDLVVYPLNADYTKYFKLPAISESYKTIDAFYPGSTIGNFTPKEAGDFLKRIVKTCGKNSGLLIGVDLKKDTEILNAAYNDSKGVTAEFNLNILKHINNRIDADFDVKSFTHHAFYNEEFGRIEMLLISKKDQCVSINGYKSYLKKEETILTEYSYKYSLDDFAEIVAGIYNIEKIWVDKRKLFSVQFLRAL
ncbi:MAG: L-histidine N(alpha)-methyltransferase [Ignavibacterium sp.]|nr:MAG: L-histidine N(alpha)-methyltransferase [Ignavibacterium sp.]